MWEHSASRDAARLVLLAIAEKAHDNGANAWPSITTLARMTRLTERSVYRALRTLVNLGELKVETNAGPKLCNRYHVVMSPDTTSPLTQRHPRRSVTPDAMSPLTSTTLTPDNDDTKPLTQSHPEPKEEPSRNRQEGHHVGSAAVVSFRPDVERLCKLLADGVQANTGERPKITKRGWLDPARLLLDRDGYTAEQVEALIRWSQDSEFWRSNILSMSKLRDKRLTLIAQARRDGPRRVHEPASWAALREL